MLMKDKNEFSDLSDHELVDAFNLTGDPWAFEAIKAEQNRRAAEKAISQSTYANKVAIGSLIVAFASLVVSIISLVKS